MARIKWNKVDTSSHILWAVSFSEASSTGTWRPRTSSSVVASVLLLPSLLFWVTLDWPAQCRDRGRSAWRRSGHIIAVNIVVLVVNVFAFLQVFISLFLLVPFNISDICSCCCYYCSCCCCCSFLFLTGASGAFELQGPGMVIVIVILVIRLDRHTGCLQSASGGGSTTERWEHRGLGKAEKFLVIIVDVATWQFQCPPNYFEWIISKEKILLNSKNNCLWIYVLKTRSEKRFPDLRWPQAFLLFIPVRRVLLWYRSARDDRQGWRWPWLAAKDEELWRGLRRLLLFCGAAGRTARFAQDGFRMRSGEFGLLKTRF